MKKNLHFFIISALLLCEASFTGGGNVFAETISGTGLTWTLTSGTLTIDYSGSGSSAMPSNYTTSTSGGNAAPWAGSRASITSIVVKDGVTSIGPNAFYNCSNATTVQISPTVTSIGSSAFNGCSKLTRVNYQKNTISSTNATSAGMWAKISFANEKANPLYYAKKLYVVKQQGSASYALYEASDVTFASPLTKVSQYVFINCTSITSATLNSCITEIETSAFKGCSNLSSIKFGNSNTNVCNVTSVAQSAFSDCTKLSSIYCYGGMEKWLNINFEKLTATPFYSSTAANRCLYIDGTNASNKVTTPTFTQNIPAYSFYKNTGLTSVTISNTVSSVGNQAFSTCPNLASVTWDVPNSAGSVDYTGSSYPPFVGCSGITSFTIGSSVVKIPRYLCYGLSGLTSITIPSLVNSIGSSAFGSCSNLATLYYEGADVDAWSNIEIGGTTAHPLNANGGDLYIGGVKQTNITLTNATIKQYAFYKCTSLTSVTLNSTVQTIQRDAFEGCANLTKANCQSLEGWCAIDFQNDQNANPLTNAHDFYINDVLQTVLNIPEEISSIGNYTFYNGTCFSSISLYGTTTFGAKTFYGCVTPTIIGEVSGSFGDGLTWRLNDGILYIEGTGAIPNYTTSSNTPWASYKECITSVVFDNNITSVGNYAFSGFNRISSITWGGVNQIGERSFENCISLTKLELSESITAIGNYAFHNCTGINYIISANTEAPNISNTSFNNIPTTTPLFVPYSAIENYNDGVSTRWNRFSNHYPYTGNCGTSGNEENVIWTYFPSANTLTISGTGAMADYANATAAPWNTLKSVIAAVIIEDGITKCGKYTFSNCIALTSISLAASCNSFGTYTFSECTALTEVAFPEGLTTTGSWMFHGCTNLLDVTLSSTLTHISSSTFEGCSSLASIDLPEGLTNIGSKAFAGCSELTTITIPRSVKTVSTSSGSYTFQDCSALRTVNWNAEDCADFNKYNSGSGFTYYTPFGNTKTNITSFNFGEHVRIIPSCLCQGMKSLTSVSLPTSVEEIHQDAFNGCTGLTSITIPANVTSLGSTVFDGCTNLTSVTTNATTPPSIYSNTFPSAVESAATLYVPANVASRTAYTEDNTYWHEFGNIRPFILSFDMQSHGDAIDAICVNAGRVDEALQPADPTEDYYTFGGWYSNEGCTTPFTFGESGTVVNSDLTLYAKWTENIFSFADTDTDNSKIADAEGKKASSVTIGRTVWKDGYYNTLCLPFSLSADEIETSPLVGYKALKRLSTATVTGTGEDRVLNIQLEPITAITAGEPFLISYEAGENIINPVFNNVTVTAATPGSIHAGDVTCHGVYARTSLGDANTNLFLGTNNTLYWPQDAEHSTMNGLRAYFSIGSSGPAYAGMRVRLTDKPAETPTGIDHDAPSTEPQSTKILRDGVLLILRDGKTYSAQGVRIQ